MQNREEILEKQESVRTGIFLSYTVEEQEIYRFVKHMSLFQLESIQAALLITLPLLFSLGCIGIGIFSQNLEFSLFAAAMFAVAATLSGKVLHRIHRVAKGAASDWGNQLISLKIYPERIIVDQKSSQMDIPLDGTVLCKCFSQMIVFFFPNQDKSEPLKFLILPLRCIDKTQRSDVKAMIFYGTRSR